jgi:hypothetical protein
MTNDNDLLSPLRESLFGLHMHTPVEAILHRASVQRRKRRAALGATVAASGAAALVAASIGSPGHAPPAHSSGPQLAAFTVTSGPGGATSLTLRKGGQWQVNAAALRAALAEHDIPALVTVGKSCDSNPEPAGLDQVITSNRQTDGNVDVTFNPKALPPGAEISIGLFPAHTKFSLTDKNASLHCATEAGQPAAPATGSRGDPGRTQASA